MFFFELGVIIVKLGVIIVELDEIIVKLGVIIVIRKLHHLISISMSFAFTQGYRNV